MKEFDIYLPPRRTECTVYIYSLPYYSGIVVVSGLVIDSAVEDYSLKKLIQAKPGLLLSSGVEETFKLIHESGEFGAILDSSVDFGAGFQVIPAGNGILLDADPAYLKAEGFLRVENGMVLDDSVLEFQISHTLGRGESGMLIVTGVDETLKRSFLGEDAQSGVLLRTDAVINRLNHITASDSMLLQSYLQNLCYHFYMEPAEENAVVIDSGGTTGSIYKALHGVEPGILIDTESDCSAEKHIETEGDILLEQACKETHDKLIWPDGSELVIETENTGTDLKRYRKLYEVDGKTLADIDNMTLDELDYVWLT